MMVWRTLLALLLFLTVFVTKAQQPSAPCGLVDALDYPIDNLAEGYDDFGLYRPRFEGNHTGIDIGFDRWGEPVRASARGRVTYSDIEGWDTEKGVVIIEHTFPDGSVAYSLYGHMEQSDTVFFPSAGSCVERGQVIGVIGWPSRGRPHLHFEFRDFLPNDGGPGYVTGNPLAEGWYNPLDFMALWRARLTSAFVSYVTFDVVATVPPVQTDSGQYIVANSSFIEGVQPPDQVLWRVETDGVVTGLAALSGNRVVAHTHQGQVIVLENGRYAAIWTVDGPDEPFLTLGETLVFLIQDGGLEAYDLTGTALWSSPGILDGRVTSFQTDGAQIGLGIRADNTNVWRLIDVQGQVVFEQKTVAAPVAAPAYDGSWLLLDGNTLARVRDGDSQSIATVSPPPGRTAAMVADRIGSSYLYLGDSSTTLVAFDPAGTQRWRVEFPAASNYLPPLMQVGSGCLLYMLDTRGQFNVFSTTDGSLRSQVQLYAGGTERTSPRARLIRVNEAEQVQVASGFLTMMTLDGAQLGGAAAGCLLG